MLCRGSQEHLAGCFHGDDIGGVSLAPDCTPTDPSCIIISVAKEAPAQFIFRRASGKDDIHRAMDVRRTVFVMEQRIDEAEEYDGLDDTCLHFVAVADGKVIGAARLRFPEPGYAKIERMAVLKPFRRCGAGAGILACAEGEVRLKGVSHAVLHAQITAEQFYITCGYHAEGPHFYEAGIEHVKMVKELG